MMILTRLTTFDNPYDPFDDFAEWYAFDTSHGYHTASFLARMVVTSDEISEASQNFAIESAINEIIRENFLGIYKKVTREVQNSQ
jgi:hypothetical protein